MKKKFKIAQAKVYSDFFTGLAITSFTGGVISPYLSESYSINSLILGLYSLFVTYAFILFAIMFRGEVKNGN
jgi:hypothetical protein